VHPTFLQGFRFLIQLSKASSYSKMFPRRILAVAPLLGVATALLSGVEAVQSQAEQYIYDYIVVGGGVTGLVVANRLTEDKNSKLISGFLVSSTVFSPIPVSRIICERLLITDIWLYRDRPRHRRRPRRRQPKHSHAVCRQLRAEHQPSLAGVHF
jgi:hypothetical protein